jgi:transposase
MPRGRPPNLERRRQLAAQLAEGLSQSEVAERLGVTKQAVSLFLRGKRRRPADFRVRCRECGQDLNPAAARADRRGSGKAGMTQAEVVRGCWEEPGNW